MSKPTLSEVRFTKTEQAIINVLRDGSPHDSSELIASFTDDLDGGDALRTHLCRMRAKIMSTGWTIISQYYKCRLRYRLMGIYSEGENDG